MKKTMKIGFIRELKQSRGRFISIMLLMFLSTFTLVGLKLVGPDIRMMANQYLDEYQLADLTVVSSYGLNADDQKLLAEQGDDVEVEYGYFTDTTIGDDNEAIRLYSQPQQISQAELVAGMMPKDSGEIAISNQMRTAYPLGSKLSVKEKASSANKVLKTDEFTVVGYVNSQEILSTMELGNTNVGTGSLNGYGIIASDDFDTDVYTIARLYFDSLRNQDAFLDGYLQTVSQEKNKLDAAFKDQPQARLAEIKDEANQEIEKNEQELKAQEEKLEESKAMMAASNGQIYSAYDSVLSAKQQLQAAQSEIDDGYQQIADAKQELAELSLPVYTISTRSETSTSSGYQVLSSLATSIDKIANVFPLLLYAVAALVTYTTMTRYVEDERINTGTLLSLGYTEREIIRKYVVYGALSSSVGAILGIILGAISIPTLLYTTFRDQFTTPDLILTFDFKVALIALVIAILCAVIPAFIVASAEFKLAPASLLLPKPPSAGSKIFLERITPIWNRMKFSQKVTARNIFRYKKRMFMTVFGVSGSVALLFTGLGMQGSIGNASAIQFGEIIDYDMITVAKSDGDASANAELKKYLDQEQVTDYMPVYIENVSVDSGVNNERQAITLNVADNFDDYVTFRDRETHDKINLKDNEVIITERLAQIEDLQVGDTFTVQSANNLPIDLKIGGITEMYMGHFIYATPQTYEQAFKQTPKLTSYLVKLKDNSADNVQAIATEVLKLDGVQTVMQNNSLIAQIDNIAVSLNAVMKMIIAISGMLAIVILYNITNINVNERMRELSTTKVLGYFDNEVTMYIYRETIILSVIGIGVGYILGHYIHLFMIRTVASLNMMFDERVVKESFIAPAILIVVVSVVLGILVHQRLKKVDMLEALKSVE